MEIKLAKYDRYKDSGVEWLGEIPKHWDIIRIKNLFSEIIERSFDGYEDLLSVSHYFLTDEEEEPLIYLDGMIDELKTKLYEVAINYSNSRIENYIYNNN